MTRAQRRLLKSLDRWGELSPDAEHEVGCTGAAFDAVVRAVIRKGWAEDRMTGAACYLAVTDTGRVALATSN